MAQELLVRGQRVDLGFQGVRRHRGNNIFRAPAALELGRQQKNSFATDAVGQKIGLAAQVILQGFVILVVGKFGPGTRFADQHLDLPMGLSGHFPRQEGGFRSGCTRLAA